MSLLESIIYGLVCGFAEFMPISSQAHRAILNCLFGVETEHPLMVFFLYLGSFLALLVSSRSLLKRLQKEYKQARLSRRRSRRQPDFQALLDISLLKTACIPMLIGLLFFFKTKAWISKLPLVTLFLILNGIILHVPLYLPRGNKDSRTMSRLDSVMIGLGGALSVLPGASRIGCCASIAVARGATPQNAYKWGLLLSIPALLVLMAFELVSLVSAGVSGLGFNFFLQCIMCGCTAYIGATVAIICMKMLAENSIFGNFSYYCWGAALFAFILYMT